MRRCSIVLALTLAAVCWLAAGPGFVGLEAALLCHHHYGAMGHHHGHSMPSDGPCVCDQMIGALDAAASDALSDAPAPVDITVARIVPDAHAALFPIPPSPSFTPDTPPPIALA
jgi:hypothetical protein